MDGETKGPARPITAMMTQRIDAACVKSHEALLASCHDEARAFGGFLRREVIRSSSGSHLEYQNVIHFDSDANLRKWEHSPERQK